MSAVEKKLKHLEFIQLTIVRLAANSFLVKAWAVTLVAALFAITVSGAKDYVFIAYVPLISFWVLDAYYLRQERLFRGLYDIVRVKKEEDITFSLNTSEVRGIKSWFRVCWSKTILLFYFPILLVLVAVSIYLICKG